MDVTVLNTRDADKSLAPPRRKQARKHVRDARDFNNIETRTVIKIFFFLQDKAPKEIRASLTETLARFLTGRAKDLSAPLYIEAAISAPITICYEHTDTFYVCTASFHHSIGWLGQTLKPIVSSCTVQ
jgi:hypothetical protein